MSEKQELVTILLGQHGASNNWPGFNPRRPYDDEKPDGYLESDNDFIANNLELAVLLLEQYAVSHGSSSSV